MKSLRMAIFACLVCLCSTHIGLAQDVFGSTTLDIDQNTGTVTATCETDGDADIQAYYKSKVVCYLYDQNQNVLASGAYTDSIGVGYAQVVLTIAAVPGTSYEAVGVHSQIALVRENFNPPGGRMQLGFDDEYNLSSFSEGFFDDPFPDYYDWFGPGPETDNGSSSNIDLGRTFEKGTYITIVYTGQTTTLNGTAQSAVVGQQIALTASYSLPSGLTVQSQSWSVPGNTLGSGYTASVASGSTSPANFSQPSTTFYWLDAANSRNVTYNLTLSDGSTTSASVPFNVSGPTSPAMTATLNPNGLTVDLVGDNVLFEYGNSVSTFGIIFNPPAVIQPSGVTGTFLYVQLITAEQEVIANEGPPTNFTCTIGTGLDNSYPYHLPSSGIANDSPAIALNLTYLEMVRTFSARMYLMWNSGIANSILVPLGSMQWGFSGDAYRSSTSSIWSLRNQNYQNPTFTPGISYPTWSTTVANSDPQCH